MKKDNLKANTGLPKIGRPATNTLENIGVTDLKQLTKFTEKEIKELHGMGPKALGILKEELKKLGLDFKKS